MEQPPKPETGKEKIEKEKVLELLRTRGMEDSEAREAVMQWTLEREASVITSRDAIVFNIERADLYRAAGDIQGALECLEDARMQAHQEQEGGLFADIEKKMDELERGSA